LPREARSQEDPLRRYAECGPPYAFLTPYQDVLPRTPGSGGSVSQALSRIEAARSSVLSALVALTKPRVISLLLVTTIAPMFAAGRDLPPWSLVMVVALAGYLMAGGANAINMWFDRDIDTPMSPTPLRPTPPGRTPPHSGRPSR